MMFGKMTRGSRRLIVGAMVILATLFLAGSAYAIPELQLWSPQATYVGDTWMISGGGTFELWVIGNVGAKGTIYDVKLAAAVATSETATGTISLTPNPSTAILSADGGVPTLGDGTALETHGIYGTGTSFYEWLLGDFTSTSQTIYDYTGIEPGVGTGQINVYSVNLTGFTSVHFDAYNSYFKKNGDAQFVFAPYSHDAGGTTNVPEPGALMLLGVGLTFIGVMARTRKKLNPY